MRITMLSNLRYWVLILLVVLLTISSHPMIVDLSLSEGMTTGNGTILSRYITLTFIVLFLMCLNLKSMLRTKFVRNCWLIYMIMAFCFLFIMIIFGKDTMLSDLRSIGISLCAIMIGWQLNLSDKKFRFLLLSYSFLIIFVGLMQILTNIGGFQILDQYLTDNKNALGVMLSTCSIILYIFVVNNQNKPFYKVLMFILFMLSLIILLTIRARAALLTTAFMIFYLLYRLYKDKNILFYGIVGITLAVIIYLILPQVMKEYVYNSLFQHHEGDFTTGRIERNINALHFLSDNYSFGNLTENVELLQIHNYILNRTFEFGIFFVLPIVWLYLYIFIKDIKGVYLSKADNVLNIGYLLLLIPFIISLAEPTFPYGPGTATVFNFIVFGLSLKYTHVKKYETSPNI